MPDLVPRCLRLVLGAALVLLGVGMLSVRTAGDDPARWHVDPLTAERTGRPNDYLVAPEGMAAAPVDRAAGIRDDTPGALMARFDRVARAAPRTAIIGGSVDALYVTYVQRSALIGFPDYVSVRAVPVPGGAALAVWSRSRYGYSDLGVNRARVERWLAALGEG